MIRVALDTNILAYAEGVGDRAKKDLAVELIERLPGDSLIVPSQVLGELHRVLTSKAGRSRSEARDAILGWADSFLVVDSTWTAFQTAFDLAADRQLQIWDSLIIAVAVENRCRFLVSEDVQNGFTWAGLTVVDPFGEPVDPMFASLLTGA